MTEEYTCETCGDYIDNATWKCRGCDKDYSEQIEQAEEIAKTRAEEEEIQEEKDRKNGLYGPTYKGEKF